MRKWNLQLLDNPDTMVGGYLVNNTFEGRTYRLCWGKTKGAARSRAYRMLTKWEREMARASGDSNEHQKGL